MLSTTLHLISVLCLAGTITAQTPDGFQPATKNPLNLSFGSNSVETAGKRIERAETSQPPSVSASTLGPSGRAILFMIDLDVNRNNTRVPLLHWLAPGVTFQSNSSRALKIPQPPPGAPYQQPSPPPGDIPHRYTFVLFPEPAGFQFPRSFSKISPPASGADRVGFNLQEFITAAKLDAPLAGNFITVQNTSSPTSASGGPSASASGTSTSQTSGSAVASGSTATGGASSIIKGITLWSLAVAVTSSTLGVALLGY